MTQYQPHTPNRTLSRGFTLVELMVTIAVMGIIAAMAAPSFSQQLAKKRMETSASSIESVLKQAKAESRIRKKNVVVSYTGDSITSRLTVAGAGDEIVLETQKMNSRSDVTPNPVDIIITPTATATATTFTICDSSITGEVGIQVQITNTARITTSKTGGCS